MRVVEPGHIYELEFFDGPAVRQANILTFLNRTCDNPNHDCGTPHPGTQSQEVLRALINRAIHLEECLGWFGNPQIIYHLRMALGLYESRAILRKIEKQQMKPEELPTARDGHWMFMKRMP